MSGTLAGAPGAGWYPDPTTDTHVRWWDGRAWTNFSEAKPIATYAPPVAPPMPVPMPAERLRPRRDALAKDGWIADPTPSQRSIDPSWLGFSTSHDVAARMIPARWSTPGVWGLAFLPWIALGIVLAASFIAGLVASYVPWIGVVVTAAAVLFGMTLLFVINDRGQLQGWHFVRPASGWWILLGPFVYLIARTVRVFSNVRRGIAPLVVFVLNVVGVWGLDLVVSGWLGV